MGGAALPAVARLSTDRAHSVLLAALLLAVALLLLSCVASPCFLRPKRGDNVSCASLNRFFLLPIVRCFTLPCLALHFFALHLATGQPNLT